MADLEADVEAAVAAVAQVQADVQNQAAPDPDGDALKSAAVAYAVSQGFVAPAESAQQEGQ